MWALEQGLRACPVSLSSRPRSTVSSSVASAFSAVPSVSVPSSVAAPGSWSPAQGSPAGVVARRSRVFSALERQASWLTYARLVEAAQWVQDWRACPPINSGLPDTPDAPDGPGERDAADEPEESVPGGDPAAGGVAGERELVSRLERVEARVDRRTFGRFGFQGTHEQWTQVMVPSLVASELAVSAGLPPPLARAMVDAAEDLFLNDRLPRLTRLLAAGWVDWPKVRLFLTETACLDTPVARAVDAAVLGRLG